MHVVEIELDQCPPGVPKWAASSELTVKHFEELLEMVPVITRLNEWLAGGLLFYYWVAGA